MTERWGHAEARRIRRWIRGIMTPLNTMLSEWMRAEFKRAFPELTDEFRAAIVVVATSNPDFGDYQCNACMGMAKALKQAPRKIAEAVCAELDPPEAVGKVEIAGPGFVNIFLADDWVARRVATLADDERLGVPAVGAGRRVVMDYGSPNVSKPLHIGHLRSHNIGSALDRMFRFLGYNVIADNHLGDWGTQFGITIRGYREFGDEERMRTHPLEELERIYVASYERSRSDKQWLAECREELVKLQAGDPENVALWQSFMTHSVAELERIYARLGVSFDIVRGESHYRDKLVPMVARLEREGSTRLSEGATVVDLDDEGLPLCIVRKSDGGFNYATTDLATVFSRIEEFAPERIVYVTDERQQLHFRQVFAICRRLGVETRLDHVWFGLMRLPEATFSTREGNVIPLEALLDEAETKALELVRESSPDMSPDAQRDVARAVGTGAVKYGDLSQNPQSVVTFRLENAVSLEGNSGPYLQYAVARIASVRDKYAAQFPAEELSAHPIVLSEPVERQLALKLLRFAESVPAAAQTYKPSLLADYLYDLAQTYSTFYQNVPFLKADPGTRESRVRLCDTVARVLRKGLHLLGIETPERI